MPSETVEIDIADRVYSLVERTQGEHYMATLESDEGKVYSVHCHHGSWTCNCPDSTYRNRGTCKHIEKLRQQQETSTMPATTETPPRDALNEARGLARPAPQQITPAPAQQSLSVPSSQSGRTQLCIALAKAQQAVGRLGHDGTVAFGNTNYKYTTSEAVIEAAKAALGGNGLALVPIEETLNGHEKEGENRFELECKFILLHISGEQLPLIRHWPVCPDRGRALDKATAAASTLCLSYLLRDLLLIPRVNPEDEVAARDDRPQQQARPARSQKPAKSESAKPELPKTGAEFTERLDTLDAWGVKKGLWAKGWLKGCIMTDADANGYPADTSQWTPEHVREAYEAARNVAQREKDKKAKQGTNA